MSKRIFVLCFLLTAILVPAVHAQKRKVLPDKRIVGVWILQSKQYEGEQKIVCGKKYSSFKCACAMGFYLLRPRYTDKPESKGLSFRSIEEERDVALPLLSLFVFHCLNLNGHIIHPLYIFINFIFCVQRNDVLLLGFTKRINPKGFNIVFGIGVIAS